MRLLDGGMLLKLEAWHKKRADAIRTNNWEYLRIESNACLHIKRSEWNLGLVTMRGA